MYLTHLQLQYHSLKYTADSNILHFFYVAPCAEGWSQWYRVERSSHWCPEIWKTKGPSRWIGNGSPAGVTRTWCQCPTHTALSMAFWDRGWVGGSLPLGISSQVHWIEKNISQVCHWNTIISVLLEFNICVNTVSFTDFFIKNFLLSRTEQLLVQ